MASDLLLPDGFAPSNLHLRPSVKTRFIEGDVFHVCERLAEISPRLFVVELTEDDRDKAAWIVMEMCPDGQARKVKKYHELDTHILPDVARMLAIPFEVRVKLAQEEIDAENERMEADNLERIYERIGQATWHQLERDGFVQRPVSYPKSPRRQAAGR